MAERARDNREAMAIETWIRRIKARLFAAALRAKASDCMLAAERICRIGSCNGSPQKHLDAAKDSLYRAAIEFKAEADVEANGRTQA